MKILIIIILAIFVIWCIGAALMYFKRPSIHNIFYQQAMDLLAGAEFYNIILTQNLKAHLPADLVNNMYGVNVVEARDILFHAGHYHFKMMQLDTTEDDVRKHIQDFLIPDFIDRINEGRDAMMSFGIFPSIYAAWIQKILNLPDGALDLDKIPYRFDMRQERAKYLLQHLEFPTEKEMEKMADSIPVNPNGVLHVMAGWANFTATKETNI